MRLLFTMLACLCFATSVSAQEPRFERTEDIIYGRKHGMCLTLDRFTPKAVKPNGAAIVFCVSGGWVSSKASVPPAEVFFLPFLDRGYTIFAVMHGSAPRFTVPEAVADMHRAVRFIRSNAKPYGLDADRIGIVGLSAGGHLSLMMGTTGGPGDPKAKDPIDRASSKVQAVAAFFPPTDFDNWGQLGTAARPGESGQLSAFKAPFDFHEFSPKTRAYEPVTDPDKRLALYRSVSPIRFVNKSTAPTLLLHGDKDTLVPLQQSEIMLVKLQSEMVPCELIVKKGQGHGWFLGLDKDFIKIADWYDTHLPAKR